MFKWYLGGGVRHVHQNKSAPNGNTMDVDGKNLNNSKQVTDKMMVDDNNIVEDHESGAEEHKDGSEAEDGKGDSETDDENFDWED